MIKEAYAIRNHQEYFAELSAIYFVGGNYYTTSGHILIGYDGADAKMLTELWRLK